LRDARQKRGPRENTPKNPSFQAEKNWLADHARRVNWPFPPCLAPAAAAVPSDIILFVPPNGRIQACSLPLANQLDLAATLRKGQGAG
jgi:hypothetical protein